MNELPVDSVATPKGRYRLVSHRAVVAFGFSEYRHFLAVDSRIDVCCRIAVDAALDRSRVLPIRSQRKST